MIDEVAKMETAGVIEPSRSAWSSPVLIIKKKTAARDFVLTSAG